MIPSLVVIKAVRDRLIILTDVRVGFRESVVQASPSLSMLVAEAANFGVCLGDGVAREWRDVSLLMKSSYLAMGSESLRESSLFITVVVVSRSLGRQNSRPSKEVRLPRR